MSNARFCSFCIKERSPYIVQVFPPPGNSSTWWCSRGHRHLYEDTAWDRERVKIYLDDEQEELDMIYDCLKIPRRR